ncbi:MAG: UDP-N-acetylmuramoyl-L-alanine--D-glutamate ligase [Bacteroidia bacterium]|jgi:UDP-N-acetylmuramoylalanine--D-glutamate ligase|nr:UDP-N-acetylmuramoyl-L-alanine--D-glutamate ligase [Bacteroidales bacterium]MDD3843340.1 UDP-N-acetylmuramoyl-L-alanine--D-glutamate ligase [Bacteroidales bacterium]MDD4617613.1 UDP-N-acetylmuramoyl-L-alanine--D-glutamate ligase [Bacteroidales bacterium]NCC46287.1 UDP-N-acetylmuramoyl-L-alanine--D-glutamate ligase [Bacteroidia bacterium]
MSKVVILGGGESGTGAAVLAMVKGHEVFLSDCNMITEEARNILSQNGIEFEEGGHTREKIMDAQLVVKSPGIPDTVPIIDEITAAGIPVISEIEFAGKYDKAKKICVTGSNGKTTTASIIYFLLKNAGLNVGLAGNIGTSYAYQVATCDYDYYVLEISSFQLDGMYDFKADIAVLLNITPDHLDRYGNEMENYIKAKFRITQNMSSEDCFIFCADDQVSIEHLDKIVLHAKQLPFSQEKEVEQGAFVKEEKMHVKYTDKDYQMFLNELSLQGKHNIYNSMAAAITGKVLNIENDVVRESLTTFQGVEHRLEKVLKVKNVLYINDSKATNVNSTWYALESMTTPVVWIAGGKDKGNDYEPLFELVKEKVRVMICLGADNRKLHECFKDKVGEIYDAASASEAVELAYKHSIPGETVLLSPACASFDLFKNFEDRGKQFKEAVSKL